jgi:hypothetical protein
MTENIAFIRGRYSPAEAADVLLSLINEKIKFHTVKTLNLRHDEPKSNHISEGRIKGLKEAKKIVEQLVLNAHKNGFEIEINSSIEIKLLEKVYS